MTCQWPALLCNKGKLPFCQSNLGRQKGNKRKIKMPNTQMKSQPLDFHSFVMVTPFTICSYHCTCMVQSIVLFITDQSPEGPKRDTYSIKDILGAQLPITKKLPISSYRLFFWVLEYTLWLPAKAQRDCKGKESKNYLIQQKFTK